MNAAAATLPNPLRVNFCGLELNSPIVLLSGCVGFGEEYTRVAGFSNRDVGAIVLKGTTGQARLGNPPHRVYETPSGMLNAIGLQNPGVDHVVRRILPTLDFSETRFFANVSGSTIEEYTEVTRRWPSPPPVLFVSGLGNTAAYDGFLEVIRAPLLTKPFRSGSLRRIIKRLLE